VRENLQSQPKIHEHINGHGLLGSPLVLKKDIKFLENTFKDA
jgi:hypothetical protein